MCIMLYKPVGKKMPSTEIIKKMFRTNPHGAGFMYTTEEGVHIRKGFMSCKELITALNEFIQECNHKTKEVPLLIHCRIATQGQHSPGLTHPYPVSSSYQRMRKTDEFCKVGFAHNGVLRRFSSYMVSDYNDSMTFNKEIVSNIVDKNVEYYKDKRNIKILEALSAGSRFGILSADGHFEMIGPWVEKDGYFFSHEIDLTPSVLDLMDI